MTVAFDKIFNFYSLLAINVAIIIGALTVGGGQLFFETGLIHIIALAFVALAVARIFLHYYTYDPVLEKYVHSALVALAVFAGSHIIEFISLVVLHRYEDAAFANVVNFYLVSILAVIIGASHFAEIRYAKITRLARKIAWVGVAVFLGLAAALIIDDSLISLDPENAAPFIYMVVLLAIGGLALFEILTIKDLTMVAAGFTNYLALSIVFIIIASLPNIFYEVLEHRLGVESYLAVYLSHFTFYIAISFLFLAFGRLSYLGGVYEDLKRIDNK